MQEMSTPKRAYEDIDPDYTDVCEPQTKRQRAIEQDAKQSVCKRIQAIARNEFQKEISNKEMELHQVDKRLNEARLMMDRLRACIVSTYYRQMNQFGTSETSSTSAPSSSIHPTVKKYLGKTPSHYQMTSDTAMSHTQKSSGAEEVSLNNDYTHLVQHKSQSIGEQHRHVSRVTPADQHILSSVPSSSSALVRAPAVSSVDASYDDRRDRFKIKKRVIIGNVSKYIPVDHRESNDKSSHKWMIYVRGPRSEPDISSFVKKVWFFLHHSYKPNDLVEISSPPFHLTRRGWGEFPVRVQLHFVDPRNKKVDIIHQLKLDKTFSGLQTLGAETTVEVDLEKDSFEADVNGNNNMRQSSSCSASLSSSYHQADPSFSSLSKAAYVTADRLLSSSHTGSGMLSKQFDTNLSDDPEADDNDMSCEFVVDGKMAVPQCQNAGGINGTVKGCVTNPTAMIEPACEAGSVAANIMEHLAEYNMTIVHDTEDNDSYRQAEEIMVTDVAETNTYKPETVADDSTADSPVVSEPQTSLSASRIQLQQEHSSSAESSVVTPLTIISKPQWLKPADTSGQSMPGTLPLSASSKSHSLTSTSAITASPAHVISSGFDNPTLGFVDQSLTAAPVSSQSSNYVLVEPSGLSVKPIVRQLCPSVSSLPSSISILPVLNTAKVIVPPVICSAQLSSSSSQHISTSASATSSSAKSILGPSVISLSQLTHQQPKFSQQPSHQSSDAQKVIIIKSSLPEVKPQIAGAGSVSLLPPKPSGPKQVSLLTGRVFTPPTLPPVATKVFSPSHRTKESLLVKHNLLTKDTCSQILASQILPNQIAKSGSIQGQVLVLKTINHPVLSVSQATDHGANKPHNSAIKLVNGLLAQDVTSDLVNMSDMVLHVPGQAQTQLTNGHSFSSFPKMSAIGITKHGKNSTTVPVMNTNLRATTDEERKRNQYEVLMAWKRNRHLQDKATAVVKVARDKIEGEADVIPELNLDDYISMRALVTAAVRLHPLVQAGVNKLTHPYCANSLEQWDTWTVGKQLGSEWHRACFVLKYLKTLLGTSGSFRGEPLMTTRQLVHWCRYHAFSPQITVLKAKQEKPDDDMPEDSNSCQQNRAHVPSFTSASTLDNKLLAEAAATAADDGCGQDVDVVDVGDTADDNGKVKTPVQQTQGCSDVSRTLECLPPSEGAIFVYDELRKRGIKLQPSELKHEVLAYTAADMLYTAMQEFIGDVLREAAAVSSSQPSHGSTAVEITRRDVHKALTQLPEAAFACNQFLGKADDVNDGGGR